MIMPVALQKHQIIRPTVKAEVKCTHRVARRVATGISKGDKMYANASRGTERQIPFLPCVVGV